MPPDINSVPSPAPTAKPNFFHKYKWPILVGLVVLMLVGAFAAYWVLIKRSPNTAVKTAPKEKSTYQPPQHSLAYVAIDGEVFLYDMEKGTKETVAPKLDPDLPCLHGQDGAGCVRLVSLSPNGKYLALDNVKPSSNNIAGVGFVDLTAKAKTVKFLSEGERPIVSPDGKLVAYSYTQTVGAQCSRIIKAVRVSDGKVTELSGSVDDCKGHQYNLDGWLDEHRLILTIGPTPGTFYIANVSDGTMKAVTVASLVKQKSTISGALISPDATKLLIGYYWGDGYDVGVVNLDGSGYKSVTPVGESPWPGSGYFLGGWSPDSRSAAYVDEYSPKSKTVVGKTIYSTIHVVDLAAKPIKQFAFEATGQVCWQKTSKGEILTFEQIAGRPQGSLRELASIDYNSATEKTIYAPSGGGAVFSCSN